MTKAFYFALKGVDSMHHHITKYRDEKGIRKAVSWFQINLFGKCYCFLKREIQI